MNGDIADRAYNETELRMREAMNNRHTQERQGVTRCACGVADERIRAGYVNCADCFEDMLSEKNHVS